MRRRISAASARRETWIIIFILAVCAIMVLAAIGYFLGRWDVQP